jgi:hypothetical protein
MGELARWLARCGGLTLDRVPHIEAYVTRLLSKEVYNPATINGQQRMRKAVTQASKCTCTKASMMMVMADQLDRSSRHPSPPQDQATSAAWHPDNGLAWPDHLTSKPGLTVQEAGSTVEGAPAKPSGAPQMDPRPPPALYTDVPMEDIEDILDWEPNPN